MNTPCKYCKLRRIYLGDNWAKVKIIKNNTYT